MTKHSPDPNGTSVARNKLLEAECDLQIVVPAYNVEKYLEACMDSILSQKTKYTFRVILVDDGSTDDTSKICNKYANDDRVMVIHQENGGLSAARNTGIKTLFGRYVMFVDSDDTLCQGAVDALLNKAYKHDCDVVEGGVFEFNDNRTGIYIRHNTDLETNDPFKSLHGHACFKIFKASIFTDRKFPEGYWFEDTVISFLIYPACKKSYAVHDMVYNYRINPDSISNSSYKNPKSIDTFWVTEKMMRERHNTDFPVDDTYFSFFLQQVTINCKRLAGLSKAIQESAFILTCDLMEKYFPANIIENSNSKLAKALKNRDFGVYRFICRIA